MEASLPVRPFELYARALDTGRKTLTGFDIGGGAPALADARQLERVLLAARTHFQLPAEVIISIETTPKIAAQELPKMQALVQLGIGRISMGVPTVNPKLLEQVGRVHGAAATNRQAALQHAISLQPEYITLYRMRYKGTRLAAQAGRVKLAEDFGL